MAKKQKKQQVQTQNIVRILNTDVLGKKLATTTALTMAGLLAISSSAYAVGDNELPSNPNVVGGTVQFGISGPQNQNMVAHQTTNRAVINWNTFNIGKKASVQFTQPGKSSIAVNRVTGAGNDPSQILGTLKSNGRVMILDPNGVFFGKNATIDVGGIIASTGDLASIPSFMSGSNQIVLQNTDIKGNKKIENQATINVADGGLLAFIAPTVKNSGIINARKGFVALAAGKTATLDFYGDNLVNVAVSGELEEALVENSGPGNLIEKGGQIYADGGTVLMTAGAAKSAVDSVVNMNGIIRANSFSNQNGKIILSSAGHVRVSGRLESKNDHPVGGPAGEPDISITGNTVNITTNAHGQFSGVTDGIFANSSSANGDGGSVYIWGTSRVTYAGKIDVRAGNASGNGGNVEISGDGDIAYRGTVDASAAHGTRGTLTIDPSVVTIGNSMFDPVVNAGYLAETLGLTNVHIVAGEKIVLVDNADLSHWGFGGLQVTNGDLVLEAPTVDLLKNLKMGHGDLTVDADTVNLGGKLYKNTFALNLSLFDQLLDQTNLHGNASVVNVLGDTASIQQGIHLATDAGGAHVYVAAGNYAENINIYKSLTLQGVGGPSQPLLFGTTPGGTVVLVSANNVTVDGFDIVGQTVPWYLPSLYAIKADNVSGLTLTNNNISGPLGAGIVLTNVSGATVAHNAVSDALTGILVSGGSEIGLYCNTILSTLTGIKVTGTDYASIIGNSVGGSLLNAIDVASATYTQIIDNNVTGALLDGIKVANSSMVNIHGNDVSGTGDDGIDVSNSDQVDVTGSNISFAGGNGIEITNVDGFALGGNHIFATGHNGIFVDPSSGSIVGNTIVGALGHGISVLDSDGILIQGNKVFGAGGDGIRVENGDFIRVLNNKVVGAGGNGIRLKNVNWSSVDSNTVLGVAGNGIYADGGHGIGIEDNFILGTGQDGIKADNVIGLNVEDNFVGFAGDDGVDVRKSLFVNIEDNTIAGTDGNGVEVSDSSFVGVDGNTILHAGRDGVNIENGNFLSVSDNFILDAGYDGVDISKASFVDVDGNVIFGAGDNGIELTKASHADVEDNLVKFSGNDGVHVENAKFLDINDNLISFSDEDGVDVSDSSFVDIEDNALFGNDGNGIKLSHVIGADVDDNLVKFSGRDGIHAENVWGLDITGNIVGFSGYDGIDVSASKNALIAGNLVSHAGDNGVEVTNTQNANVTHNSVFHAAHDGLFIDPTSGSATGNFIVGSGHNGITILNSDGFDVIGNTVLHSGHDGIAVYGSDGVLIKHNFVSGSGNDGIHVAYAHGTGIFGNTAFFSGGDGIDLEHTAFSAIAGNNVLGACDSGIEVSDSFGTLIAHNTVHGVHGDGISVDDSAFTRISHNHVGHTGGNAINIEDSFATGIVGNTLHDGGGGGAGIRVSNSGFTFMGWNSIEGFYNGIEVAYSFVTKALANTISGIVNDGIQVAYSNVVSLIGNDVTGYGDDGAQVSNSDNVLIANNFFDGGNTGIRLGDNEGYYDDEFQGEEKALFFIGTAPYSGNGDVVIANNLITNNGTGLHAMALNNGSIDIRGNQFTDNEVGMSIGSGVIDLTHETNTFTGGSTAMIFDGPYYPSEGYTGLSLVDDTIGTTVFEGQSDYYIELRNGAFFEPGRPTIIDGTLATYDGVFGGLMTAAQLSAIEAMINDYDDDHTLGQIFPGFSPLDDNRILKKFLGNRYNSGRAGVIVTGLPRTGGAPTPAFTLQDLANLAPAAGGDNSTPGQLTVQDLAKLAPAAGGEDNGKILNGACWSNLGQSKAIMNIDLGDDPTSILSDQASCNKG